MIDEKYINYIYDTYSKSVLRISYTYLKNSTICEDVLQEVILKILNKNIKFNDSKKERNWIIKVTTNLCKDILKSSTYKRNIELKDDLSYLPKEQEEVLNEVLKLPEKYRIVIYLYYYEDYSLKEISKILKQKVSTIGTWLARGKKELAEQLKGEWENE